jgi:hypothetical protein
MSLGEASVSVRMEVVTLGKDIGFDNFKVPVGRPRLF